MFFHAGSLNRGCEAIVRSSTNIIKGKLKGTQIYLASGKPESDKFIPKLDKIIDGSDLKIKRYSFDWLLSSVYLKLFNDESFAFGRIHKNVINNIKDADVCLSIGGDNYCYGEQPGWYEVNKRVKKQGKKGEKRK